MAVCIFSILKMTTGQLADVCSERRTQANVGTETYYTYIRYC